MPTKPQWRDAKLTRGQGFAADRDAVYAVKANGERSLIEKAPRGSGITLFRGDDGRRRYAFTRRTEPIEEWEAFYRHRSWSAAEPQTLDPNEEPFRGAGGEARKRLVNELGRDELLRSLRVFYDQGWTRERLSAIYAHADWADEVGAEKARHGLDPLSDYVREVLRIERTARDVNAPVEVRNAIAAWRTRATMLLLLQSPSELDRVEREVAEGRAVAGMPKTPRFKRPGKQRSRYARNDVRRKLFNEATRAQASDPVGAVALVEVAWLLPIKVSSKDPDQQLPRRPELHGLHRAEAANVVRAALRATRDAIRRVTLRT